MATDREALRTFVEALDVPDVPIQEDELDRFVDFAVEALEAWQAREQRLDDEGRKLLRECFDAWNGTGPAIVLDRITEYLSKAHRDRSAPPPDVVLPPLPERDWTPDGINSLWSLNSMRAYARAAVELNRPSAPSGAIPAGYVKIPESVPEAEAMILAANAWLESVAPEGKV